jgi:N,N'-diacetyllegionaminate synthase
MIKVIIIAEAGVNHNGDFNRAIEMIRVAADTGADYIKFQTFLTELNISKNAKKADYQSKNTGNDESQFEMVKRFELTFEDFKMLKEVADFYKIGFLSTAFDIPSLDFICTLGIDYLKIPSGEITNKPLLKQIASKKKKTILSTGMSDMTDIENAIDILVHEGLNKEDITILHCNTEYPTPMVDVNLMAMQQIAQNTGFKTGYSDHTLGIEVPIAAVALGAVMIEKHFTLDRSLPGPDHKASLDPIELKSLVNAIRNIEQALSGSGLKKLSKSEQKNKSIARKSIHINRNLLKGHTLTFDDLVMLRPGEGISPMEIDEVIGKKLKMDLAQGNILQWDFLQP